MFSCRSIVALFRFVKSALTATYGLDLCDEVRIWCNMTAIYVTVFVIWTCFDYNISVYLCLFGLFIMDIIIHFLKMIYMEWIKVYFRDVASLEYTLWLVFHMCYLWVLLYLIWSRPCVPGIVFVLWIYAWKHLSITYKLWMQKGTNTSLHFLADWSNPDRRKACQTDYAISSFIQYVWKFTFNAAAAATAIAVLPLLYESRDLDYRNTERISREALSIDKCTFKNSYEHFCVYSDGDLCDGLNMSHIAVSKRDCPYDIDSKDGLHIKKDDVTFYRFNNSTNTTEGDSQESKLKNGCIEIISIGKMSTFKTRYFVIFIQPESLLMIKDILLPQEIQNNDNIHVLFYHMTDLHHIGSEHTKCLNCSAPVKRCNTSERGTRCYISISVGHANTFGDFELRFLSFDSILDKTVQYIFPYRIRLLPKLDDRYFNYIPHFFLTKTKIAALKLVQNKTILHAEENLPSLIYSIESQVEIISFETMRLIVCYMYCVFLFLYLKIGKLLFKEIERYEEKLDNAKKEYDVFVFYLAESRHDQQFVEGFFLEYLKSTCELKVNSCFDTTPGLNVFHQYTDAITKSKTILIIWSEEYENDEICFNLQVDTVIIPRLREKDISKNDVFVLRCHKHQIPLRILLLLEKSNIHSAKWPWQSASCPDHVTINELTKLVNSIVEAVKEDKSIFKKKLVSIVSKIIRKIRESRTQNHHQD